MPGIFMPPTKTDLLADALGLGGQLSSIKAFGVLACNTAFRLKLNAYKQYAQVHP